MTGSKAPGILGVASLPKPSGHLITTPLDGGPVTVLDTFKCVHCQRHWVHTKATAKMRRHCPNCDGWTCGHGDCLQCVHWEQRLENLEAGRPELHKPVRVSFADLVPPKG